LFFSCESLRKRIIFNDLHFSSKENGVLFSYPYSIQPLIARNNFFVDVIENEMLLFG